MLSGEVLGGKAIVAASAGAAGVAVDSITIGLPAGVSAGAQPVKRMTARDRASQTVVITCW